VDSKDKYGLTPLFSAVKNSHEAVVRLLFENGANVDSQKPLLAAFKRYPEFQP
jgi:ankyrin repeat protein